MPYTDSWFNAWAANMKQQGRAAKADLRALQHEMFRDVHGEFVFSVSCEFVSSLDTPLMVLKGEDYYHPTATSKQIVELAPNAELIEAWRSPRDGLRVQQKVEEFLREHGSGLGNNATRARL